MYEVGGRDESAFSRLLEQLPDADGYETDAYQVYEWLPPDRRVIGKGGAVNWNEGLHSKLRSKLNRLVGRTKCYAKSVEMLKHLLAIALEDCLNQSIKPVSRCRMRIPATRRPCPSIPQRRVRRPRTGALTYPPIEKICGCPFIKSSAPYSPRATPHHPPTTSNARAANARTSSGGATAGNSGIFAGRSARPSANACLPTQNHPSFTGNGSPASLQK